MAQARPIISPHPIGTTGPQLPDWETPRNIQQCLYKPLSASSPWCLPLDTMIPAGCILAIILVGLAVIGMLLVAINNAIKNRGKKLSKGNF